jgi:hypothetical protein
LLRCRAGYRFAPNVGWRIAFGVGVIAHTAFKRYPKRTVLGLALFTGQAFLYNAGFFTQALVLSTFFGVEAAGKSLEDVARPPAAEEEGPRPRPGSGSGPQPPRRARAAATRSSIR